MQRGNPYSMRKRRFWEARFTMANFISRDRQIQVLRMLVEGSSIRSTERYTGTHRDTIMRLLVRFGNACEEFHDLALANVSVEHVQCDEIWTFVKKKEARLDKKEKRSGRLGDMYLFTALDTDTKLMVSYLLGRRTAETTETFIRDLESRMVRPPMDAGEFSPQISTDGFTPYQSTIREAFGETARHGVLVKNYVNPEVGRYAPPDMVNSNRTNIRGIRDLWSIVTSHVERHNLTIRTFMKRFTRLALGFSKKVENLAAATSLHVAFYNFCWRPRHHEGGHRLTPAMAAGVVDELWSIERLYDEVMELRTSRQRAERNRRLVERLRGEGKQ